MQSFFISNQFMQKIKHVFFDLDNTLWDHRKNARLTLQKLFQHYTIKDKYNIDFEDFHTEYDRVNEGFWAGLRDEKIDKAYLRKHRFYDTFLKFEIDDFKLSQNFENQFLDEIVEFNEVVPGTFEILNYLKEQEYVLHIITNGFEEVSEAKTINSDMKKYIETLTCADEIGIRKPDPKIFALAMEKAGSTKDNSIIIGDDWIADVIGGTGFGWQAIFFDVLNDNRQLEGVPTIKSLSEIKHLL